ncbi:hypothetical protein ACF0H5_003958 [Mactra antiquata]
MRWKLLSFVLIIWCMSSVDIISGNSLPELSSLCPYNDFCSSTAVKTKKPNESHLFPCCQKCSCEPDCQYFGNCCPDKILKPGVQIKYPCVDLSKYLNIPRRLTAFDFAMGYRMVDDCPSFELSSLYPKCFVLEDLEDFIVVSDPITDRVYKNKHCALCNGVRHYTQWKLKTDCGIYTQKPYTTLSQWYSYIARTCRLTPLPPAWTDGLSVKCNLFPERTKKCNSTGRWKQQNQDVQYACETENQYTSSLLYSEIGAKVIYYENAYCKLCNTENDEVWPDLCKRATLFGYRKSLHQFNSFINFMEQDFVDNKAKVNCLEKEIWDHYNEECIAVSCPSSTFFLRDKCEHLFIALPGQAFEIMFKVTVNRENYFWDKEDAQVIHRVITQLVQNEDCHQCGTFLMTFNHTEDTSVIARYELETQGTCTLQFLMKKLQALIAMPLDKIRKDNFTNFTITPDLDVDITVIAVTLQTANVYFCSRVKYIDRTMIDPCPRIVLSEKYRFNVTSFKPSTLRSDTTTF